jgi:seryl-tRNA synthetase
MIDLKDLRENPDRYRRGAELKRYDPAAVDAALAADRRRIEAQQEHDALRAEQNTAGKDVGKLKGDEKQAAIARLGELKSRVKAAEERQKQAETELAAAVLQVPLPPDEDVPVGRDETENVILRYVGEPRQFDFEPKDHIQLAESLGLADFQAGVRIAGSRSYVLTGAGALLHNAVLRLALEMMTVDHGFTAAVVPVLVREEALIGTGFFPAGRESVYHAGQGTDDLFLVGTGEVGLTALHMNQTLEEGQLPLKYTTVSTCFRREAGTYGKDTAGLYRVHQFDKCEQVVICRNDVEESKRWHAAMLGYSEEILGRLGLPYRVIQCCTGDLGVKNASMIDVETYMPSRMKDGDPKTAYGETHSASRLYDFQSRRLNLRYRDAAGRLHFCHTLNNTVIASPRILIAILENCQNADGSVTVPESLRRYMGGMERIEA